MDASTRETIAASPAEPDCVTAACFAISACGSCFAPPAPPAGASAISHHTEITEQTSRGSEASPAFLPAIQLLGMFGLLGDDLIGESVRDGNLGRDLVELVRTDPVAQARE